MADTYSLRFEIDASRAEAGAKKFNSAINSINSSLDKLDSKAEAAFAKLLSGASSGGDFGKLAKDFGKLNTININPNVAKNITSLGNALRNFKAPSATAMKNVATFASTVPALLNGFNISSNFADSLNKVSSALSGFKVPSASKVEALKTFGESLQKVAPSLRVSGSFSGIEKLGAALGGFRAPSEKAITNMREFFNALNGAGSTAKINSSLVSGIINLSAAVGALKAPSATSVNNLKDLFTALSQMKSVNGVSSIAKLTQAFSGFKGPTQAQTKNLQAFVTMLGNLKVPSNVAQIASYLQSIGQAASSANTSLSNFRNNLNGIGFRGFNSQAHGLTTNLRGLENAFSGTFQAASVFRTLIGSITLGTLSKAVYDANVNFLAFKSTLMAVNNGDMKATGEEMRYVEDMANRLGQRVTDIQESFGGFSVSSKLAGVSTEQTRKIFESTVTAMTVLHRSSDRTKLALLALEQMMSKGKVSSEELRRQLGEQLPGAVNLMARALGVGADQLSDMMKKGEVYSSDALPKFAAEIQKTYGPALAASLDNAVSQFNLLYNAMNSIFILVGQSGTMEALAKSFASLKDAISAPEFSKFAVEFGQRTGVVIEKLGQAFTYLVQNIDTVVNAFKILLALNIGRFLASFTGLLLGSISNMGAWGASINALKVAFTGMTTAVGGASTAVGVFGRVAAAASVLSGPIGAAVFAVAALGTAWLTSGKQGTEFSFTLDKSKEAMDRYNESLQVMTASQLGLSLIEQKDRLEEIRVKVEETRASYQELLNNAPSGKRWVEVEDLANTLKNLKFYLDDTGQTYNQFVADLATKTFNTKQADQLRIAFLEAQKAIDLYGAESEIARQKTEALNVVMNNSSASGFVATMNAAASAASSMAGVVAEAANDVANAFAKMNMSKAQSTMADKFIDLAAENDAAFAALDKVSDPDARMKQEVKINKMYGERRTELNKLAEKMYEINKQTESKKNFDTTLERMGGAATAAGQKIADAKKELEDFNKAAATSNADPTQIANARAQLEAKLYDAQNPKGKGGKKKGGGGGGGGAASYLDDAGKATLKYRKEQEALDKMLNQGKITQDQYNGAIDKLKTKYGETATTGAGFTAEFTKLKEELMPATQAMSDFIQKKAILDQQLANSGNLSEYTELMTRLRKQYSDASNTGSPWIDGMNKGLLDLTKTSEDFTSDVAGAVSNAFGGLEDALTNWVTTGKMDFKSLATSILGDIARIVIRYTIIQPIIQALSTALGGGSTGVPAAGTAIPIPTPRPFAKGGVFSSGNIVPFAKGGLTNGSNSGIVAQPTLFSMAGKKTGLMGEAGPEAIMPVTRTKDGKLGVAASGAVQASTNVSVQPKVTVNIQTPSGTTSRTEQRQNSQGDLDLSVFVEQIKSDIQNDIAKGGTGLNRAIEGRYRTSAAAGNMR